MKTKTWLLLLLALLALSLGGGILLLTAGTEAVCTEQTCEEKDKVI